MGEDKTHYHNAIAARVPPDFMGEIQTQLQLLYLSMVLKERLNKAEHSLKFFMEEYHHMSVHSSVFLIVGSSMLRPYFYRHSASMPLALGILVLGLVSSCTLRTGRKTNVCTTRKNSIYHLDS